jgi:hypothetical protein
MCFSYKRWELDISSSLLSFKTIRMSITGRRLLLPYKLRIKEKEAGLAG